MLQHTTFDLELGREIVEGAVQSAPGVMVTIHEVMERCFPDALKYALEHWEPIGVEDDVYKMCGPGIWDGENDYIVGLPTNTGG